MFVCVEHAECTTDIFHELKLVTDALNAIKIRKRNQIHFRELVPLLVSRYREAEKNLNYSHSHIGNLFLDTAMITFSYRKHCRTKNHFNKQCK